MGRAVPAADAADGALGTLAVQGANLETVPLLRALAARGRLRLTSWPPRSSTERQPGLLALLVCDGLLPASPLAWMGLPLLAVSTRAPDDMPGRLQARMGAGARAAIAARAFQGFVTSGWLGVQPLLALGVPRERIALGWGALEAGAWRAEVGPARRARSQRRTALVVMNATEQEREAAEAVVNFLAHELRIVRRARPEDDARAFASADVFVQLGTHEPWSESLLRAGMVGLPLVSSCCARAADLVVPGRTGALLTSLDPAEALAGVHAALQLPRPGVAATLLRLTGSLDASPAAQEVERLVESLSAPAPWRPLPKVMDDLFRNRWGWAHP